MGTPLDGNTKNAVHSILSAGTSMPAVELSEAVKDAMDPPPDAAKVKVPASEPALPAGSLGKPEEPEKLALELEDAQQDALTRFADLVGSSWKTALKAMWEKGDYAEMGVSFDENLRVTLEQIKALTDGETSKLRAESRSIDLRLVQEASRIIKVLLPDATWDGELNAEAYENYTEGVWLGVTDGSDENGEGVIVSRPLTPAFNGIDIGDLVQFKTLVGGMKPIVIARVGAAERDLAGSFGEDMQEKKDEGTHDWEKIGGAIWRLLTSDSGKEEVEGLVDVDIQKDPEGYAAFWGELGTKFRKAGLLPAEGDIGGKSDDEEAEEPEDTEIDVAVAAPEPEFNSPPPELAEPPEAEEAEDAPSDKMKCKSCNAVFSLKGDAANPVCPKCGGKYLTKAPAEHVVNLDAMLDLAIEKGPAAAVEEMVGK